MFKCDVKFIVHFNTFLYGDIKKKKNRAIVGYMERAFFIFCWLCKTTFKIVPSEQNLNNVRTSMVSEEIFFLLTVIGRKSV